MEEGQLFTVTGGCRKEGVVQRSVCLVLELIREFPMDGFYLLFQSRLEER